MIRTLGMFPNIHPRRIPAELKELVLEAPYVS
jgi:hypothetical protein